MSWEVWTMKSKTSFFDPTLLKKNLGRFAPAWALLSLALFLNLPLPMLRSLSSEGVPEYRLAEARRFLGNGETLGYVYAFFAALLFAALVFKYLHRTRDAYMMHAFPMTRSCQFVTNAVSGLLFWLLPALFTVLCSLGVLALFGVSGCGGLAWAMLGRWLLAFLCFYGIAVFAMQLSGNTFIAVMSYGALNFMFLVVPLLCLMLAGFYFKGFDYVISGNILRLAPIVELLRSNPAELCMLWIYGGLGLALLALSWYLYRLRHVERAGDAMVYPWARIAFRLLFTLCVTLGFGWLMATIFGSFRGSQGDEFLPFALIGCVLGWFASSMMVERTVKVFKNKKVWLGFAACAAVLILAVIGLKYDLLGFQRKVPETEQIASVEIWTTGDYGEPGTDCIELTQAADLELIRDFHGRAAKSTSPERSRRDLFGYYSYDGYSDVHILYHLKDGGTLRRAYVVTDDSDYQRLGAIFARPDVAEAWYEKTIPQRPEDYSHITIFGVTEYVLGPGNEEYFGGDELECKNPGALREAILTDARAGRLPVLNFLNRFSYFNDVEFKGSSYNEVYLCFERKDPNTAERILQIPIADSAQETLKLFLP